MLSKGASPSFVFLPWYGCVHRGTTHAFIGCTTDCSRGEYIIRCEMARDGKGLCALY